MQLKFIDGYTFTAPTKQAACEAIWHSMRFTLYDSLTDWMQANAKVIQNAYGVSLRTDSPDNHFADMVSHGILTVTPDTL